MIRLPAIVPCLAAVGMSLTVGLLADCSVAQAPVWRELAYSTFGTCEVAWDSGRQRLVAVSGGRTYEWEGLDWRLRATPTETPMRVGSRICYDDLRRGTLLFGGQQVQPGSNPTLPNTLWLYDGSDWRQVASGGPPGRVDTAMAFDRARGRVVLFGGSGTSSVLGDTWEWNGVSWLQRQGAGPGPRFGHVLAYDSGTSRTILFGGRNLSGAALADTWAWNGTAWTQLQPATTPPPRILGAMAADPVSGRLVLLGGFNGTTLIDCWEWNGANWLAAPPFSGVVRRGFGMAVNGSGQTFVVGGLNATVQGWFRTLGDTWVYPGGGAAWQAVGAGGPPWADEARIVYDSQRGRLVLVARDAVAVVGQVGASLTWEWTNGVWTRATPANNLPLLYGTRFAFDSARGVTVAFGGTTGLVASGETREWDGVDWVLRPVTGPSPRSNHHLVYDEQRAQVVLFSGFGGASDTWTYDGTAWTLAATTGPSARFDGAMAYDANRGRVVLFGGFIHSVGSIDDTWEWDGVTWTRAYPVQSPSARYLAAFAYDRLRQRTVLVGGLVTTAAGGYLAARDQWLWDGVAWTGGPANVPVDVRTNTSRSLSMTWCDPLAALVLMTPRPGDVANDFWLGAPDVATVEPGGPGCVAATAPALRTFGVPRLGDSAFAFEVVGAAANTMTWIGVSASGGTYALGAGCTLYVQSPYASVGLMTNAAGFAVRPFPVPNSPLLLGVASTAQAASIDSGSSLGYVVTGELTLRLGM